MPAVYFAMYSLAHGKWDDVITDIQKKKLTKYEVSLVLNRAVKDEFIVSGIRDRIESHM